LKFRFIRLGAAKGEAGQFGMTISEIDKGAFFYNPCHPRLKKPSGEIWGHPYRF